MGFRAAALPADPSVGALQLFTAVDAIVWWDPRDDTTWTLPAEGVADTLFLHAYR